MSVLSRRIYRFGDFSVDTDQKVLFRHGKPVPLTPKLFDTLVILIEHDGRIVPKEELMSLLWPNTFVEEANLTSNIQQLRKSLGDSARAPQYIETVPKRGYRFIAAILTDSPESALVSVNPTQNNRSRWLILSLILCVVFLSALGISIIWWRSSPRPTMTNPRTMLAVLPFKNLTNDPAQDYFNDGLTEEMITQLGHLDPQRLAVIARTSVMHYKNSDAGSDRIARELGVQYLLEGGVRREAATVRITVQLIKASDQTEIWSRQYDRELSNLLQLQGEIAQEVADEIQVALTGENLVDVPTRTTSSPSYEAYDLYLKGQYFWNKRTVEGFQKAIDYFQQAADKDPEYARAFAGLANSYALLGGYSGVPQSKFIEKARAAALHALAINEQLPEAHCALALIVQNYDWDWQTADREYRRAIELNPNYATAHEWYAEHLALLGRFDAALRESESARQLDPFSLIIAVDNGTILYFARQYDRAADKLRAVLELDPNFLKAHLLEHVYVQKQMFAEAQSDLKSWRNIDTGPWSLAETAYVMGRCGHEVEAKQAFEKLERLDRRGSVDPELIAWAAIGIGRTDETFDYLQRAIMQHSNMAVRLKVEPAFDSLRNDPRFKDLLHRVHLG
ncbi:MAG TPA: winged helix-turn-helix domain-containing protein [Pyrinomonadaceae bacterium]|nr:winged helix-turn-helix domain-containing protein [Pyrinomonadaceae bacterium]